MDPLTRFWSLFGITLHLEHMTPKAVLAIYAGTLFAAAIVLGFAIAAVDDVLTAAYWRRGDTWITTMNLLLLALVFLVRGGTGTGALREVGGRVLHRFLPDLLPRAIVSQWLLLCVFWFVFGLLLRMRTRVLLAPLEYLAVSLGQGALYVAVGVCWYEICVNHAVAARLEWGLALAAAWVALSYYGQVAISNPYTRALLKKAERTRKANARARRAAGHSNGRDRWHEWWSRRPEAPEHGWRWRYSAAEAGPYLLRSGLALAVIIGAATLPFALHAAKTPTLGSVVRGMLLVYLFTLIGFCFSFSRNAYDIPQVPPALPRLAQFTTTLSAFALAAVAMAHHGRQWSQPAVLAALGAPLLTALVVFVVKVLPTRRSTDRWGIAVGAAVLLAACLLPLGPALNRFTSAVVEGLAHRI